MTSSTPASREPTRLLDRILLIPATGLGLGFAPYGPGTVGSLLGPPLIWSLDADVTHPWRAVIGGILFFFIGVPICYSATRALKAKDPKQVVFDEIAAFFWVFCLCPVRFDTAIGGFLLFRLFDIVKPWPVRRLERLPHGWGIMADDTCAGLIAGVLLGGIWWAFTIL